jgi:hypothetical protein
MRKYLYKILIRIVHTVSVHNTSMSMQITLAAEPHPAEGQLLLGEQTEVSDVIKFIPFPVAENVATVCGV